MTETQTSDTLTISRTYNATAERVFSAWTDPESLKSWFGPEGVETIGADVDLSVGGRYDLHMRTPEGSEIHHFGTYREIDPFRRLVFTWVLDGQACGGSKDVFVETLVAIDLEASEDAVELTLTHSGFPNQASCDGHRFGWDLSLQSLDRFVE
jgi:uncharacterized protein YndB with AHSA1/START domain